MSIGKIIIHHGERVTEHEIGDLPLVIGRDPQCDLFFADKKLSRRHARFERDGDDVRLVDLGSRNGSWVNDEPVEDRLLGREDSVRLGGLQITLEYPGEPETGEDAESTLLLTGSSEPATDGGDAKDESGTVILPVGALATPSPGEDAGDDSSTVLLPAAAVPDAEAPRPDVPPATKDHGSGDDVEDESGTVMLPAGALPPPSSDEDAADASSTVLLSPKGTTEEERSGPVVAPSARADEDGNEEEDAGTVMLPVSPLPAASPDEDPTMERAHGGEAQSADRTVMLPSDPPRKASDTGAVIFRGKADPSLDASTRIASSTEEAAADAAPSRALDDDSGERSFAGMAEPGARSVHGGSFRFAALVAAIAALAVLVLALPLTRTLGKALSDESSRRGRTLVELLAVTNERALSHNPPETLSLAWIAGEPGVIAVHILDPAGRVLASRESPNAASTVAELGANLANVRTFRRSEAPNGDVVLITPIVGEEGRRLGLAVLQYRVAAASGRTIMMLVLGALLLLMGVAFAVVLARRWTLLPIVELRDDVEALREGYVGTLPEDRPYSELSEIARGFNELLHERVGAGSDSGPFSQAESTQSAEETVLEADPDEP